MVEDETINNVVDWVYFNRREIPQIRSKLEKLHIFIDNDQDMEKLGQAMFKLNQDAIIARYGKGEPEKFRPLDYKYTLNLPKNPYQVLKSLQCWNYQCSEGDVPETDLYKIMEDLEHYIMYKIVSNTPEYSQAKWG